jgi:hypothetical protein
LACFLAAAAAFVPTITTTSSRRQDTSLALLDRKSYVGIPHTFLFTFMFMIHIFFIVENTLLALALPWQVWLGTGIGLVAFTEAQGECAKQRGSGLSEGMSTRIAGQVLEDVQVSSVQVLGSLTCQLEAALKETGGNHVVEEYFGINPSSWSFWLRGAHFVVRRAMEAFPSCFPIRS